ncbi:MAG: hypothetical protein MH472_03000 [Bacteroidia bacterium]|nr:hypothetical protein [Bacteroidia bacterium]
MNNFENIPSELFDWLNQSSFEQLNTEQQKTALTWFSPEEYNSLHLASKTVTEEEQKIQRNANRKQQLLHYFESTHRKNETKFYHLSWIKIAALFLALLGIQFMWTKVYFGKQESQHICKIDTQYVYTQMPNNPIYYYDTVYLTSQSNTKEKSSSRKQQASGQKDNFISLPEMKIKDFSELNAEANQIRGNSLKDDTLLNTYSLVRL